MKEWQVEDLNITVDSVLRGQGAELSVIRSRNPRLVITAREALNIGRDLLKPQGLIKELVVTGITHDHLLLEGEKKVTGPLVTDHLAGVQFIKVVVCTVGSNIDEYASEVMKDNIVLGLALDGVGSAAVEALANLICREIELEAEARKCQSTIPLSPGMVGWSVEEGQPLIFNLVDASFIGVELSPFNLMTPRKSLSMIIGLGPSIHSGKCICDFCTMKETCRYREHCK
jgi:hypothetical protein